jgi:hypothetical protein
MMFFNNSGTHPHKRQEAIKTFVGAYNEEQEEGARERSVQYAMHRLREDIERLRLMKYSIGVVFEGHRVLLSTTKAFVRTQSLNNTDVNSVFLKMKTEQYERMQCMERFTDASLENHVKTSQIFDEYIEEFEQAYKAKEKTLVLLRKNVANDLILMFNAYRQFCTVLPSRAPLALVFKSYMHHIIMTSGLYFINEHLIDTVLKSLGARK